jgi:hypothetical protein
LLGIGALAGLHATGQCRARSRQNAPVVVEGYASGYESPVSKVDAQRAMREARYARQTQAPPAPGPPRARVSPIQVVAPVEISSAEVDSADLGPVDVLTAGGPDVAMVDPAVSPEMVVSGVDPASEPVCGHRNMGGKSCQRPAGHAEKNHRYQ